MDNLQVIIEAAIAKAKSDANIKKYVKEVQGKIDDLNLDVKVSDANVKSAITKVNKAVQDGSRENIRIRQQELRNQKMAFQEEQLLAKKQLADKINSSKVSKQTINEEITNRRQAIQMQKLQSQEERIRQQELKQTSKVKQDAFILEERKSQSYNRIGTYISNNPKLGKSHISTLKELQNEIGNVNNKSGLDQINAKFRTISSNSEMLGKVGDTAFSKLGKNVKQFVSYLGAATVVMTAINGLRDIVSNVKEIDSAMISLKKVTSETDATYSKFLTNTAQKAKQLGSSISDLVNSTADFARLGYNLEDSSELSEVAALYKNVGDGIDISEASESIISTLKAFNIEAKDSIQIVDKFNEVGNNFAISSSGIGTALQKSASAMASANNTLDESIALITAGNNVVQDPDAVGTALKTVSLRLRSTSADIQAMGEDSEGAAETVSNLRDTLLALTDNKVDIQIDEDTYASTYDIMLKMSKVWSDLTDMERASALELMFGKRQANIGASILTNMTDAENALTSSLKSSGSAMAEQEAHMKSIEFSADRLKASLQELSSNTLDSSWIKGFLDLSNVLVNTANNVGIFNIALLTTSGILGGKGIFMIPKLATFIGGLIQPLLGASAAAGTLAGTMGAALSVMLPVAGVTLLIKLYDQLNVSLEEQKEITQDLQSEYSEIQTELSGVNSELETTAQRIDELNNKDSLTLVEQEELRSLQQANTLLERQQQILEKQAEIKQRQVADSVNAEFGKDFSSGGEYRSLTQTETVYGGGRAVTSAKGITESEYLEEVIDAYNRLSKIDKSIITEEEQKTLENYESFLVNSSAKVDEYVKSYGIDDEVSQGWKQLSEDIYATLYPAEYLQQQFEETFNSIPFADVKQELTDLAKSGELTPETLSSSEKYKTLLTETGTTAEEAAAHINASIIESVDGLNDSVNETTQSVSTLSEAISAFQDTSDALDKVKSDLEEVGTISSDTINKLLGMENAEIESAIASYLTSGDANEILNTLSKIYETDLSNFKQVMLAKMETDESFWNTVMTNNAELVKGLAEKYNLDLSNWTSLAKAKASIETQLINNLASAWSKYYKTQVDANTGLLSVVDTSPNAGKDTYKGNSPYSDKFSKNTGFNAINEALSAKLTKEKNEAKSKVQAQVNAYNDAIKGLDNIAGISVDISADGLKDATAATKDLGSAAKDTKDELQELLDLFNDLEKGYDLRLNLFTDRDDKLQKSIDILEAQGNIVGEALYEELISSQEKQVKILQQKKTDFERFLSDSVSSGKLTVGTEEWFKMTQAIEDTKDEIMDATANVEKFQNAINDLHWEGFEQIIEHFEGLNSELDSIQSLLSRDDMVVDFTGDWTDEGITSLGLYGQAYELAQYQANKYAEEIEYLTNAYNQGLYSELEYQDKLRELNQAQWDSIDAANKAKDGIIELNEARVEAIKNGINKETEALEELINKKIELLDIEKDTHDFKKSVEEQETEISDLQRQLSALSTNDSAEAAAKRKLIQAELLEANKKLEETYYQESISQQKIALQKELDDFKTTQDEKIAKLDDSLDNQDALIKASLDTVLTNQRTVYNTLTQLGTQYGIQLSSAITDPWISGQNALSQYSGYFNDQMSGFKNVLDGITSSYDALQSAADSTASRIVGSLAQIEQSYVALKNAAEAANSAMGSSSGGGGGGGNDNKSSTPSKKYYITSMAGKKVSEGFNSEAEARRYWERINSNTRTDALWRYYGINKFAKGVKKVKEDQWAITNEPDTGRELIYNPKEGFLTPLSKDTSVLKNDYTETIFDFLENPKGFMLGQLGLDKLNIPNIPVSNNNGGSMSIGSLVTVNGNIDDNNFGKIQKVVKQEIQNSWKQFSTTSKRNRN